MKCGAARMSGRIDAESRVDRYCKEAERVRRAAAATLNQMLRRHLLGIACDYKDLAEAAEAIARSIYWGGFLRP